MSIETSTPRIDTQTLTDAASRPNDDPWNDAWVVSYHDTVDAQGETQPGLLDTTWLQVARETNVAEATAAKSYADLLARPPRDYQGTAEEWRAETEAAVMSRGERFDETLLGTLRALYLMRRLGGGAFNGLMIIRAETDSAPTGQLGGWQSRISAVAREAVDQFNYPVAGIRVEQVHLEDDLPAGVASSEVIERRH